MKLEGYDIKRLVAAVCDHGKLFKSTDAIHQCLEKDLDKVTAAVANQYEANPYPIWSKPQIHVATSLSNRLSEIGITDINLGDYSTNSPSIMVAGCGTGKHAISTATKHPMSNVEAVDLSLPSLSFAFHKATEFGISNIEFHQASILSLPNYLTNFGVIECCGVLHHLDDPEEGLSQLSGRLAKNGVMKIALYSAVARRILEPLKRAVSDFSITSDDDLRSARSFIKTNFGRDNIIYRMGEFYSLSGLRDLLFHEKEHQFSLSQIQDLITRCNLSFKGMEVQPEIRNIMKKRLPPGNEPRLEDWEKFESENPLTFLGMYQFWVQRL